MAVANDTQMNNYAARMRRRAEQFRQLYLAMKDDKAAIEGGVYERAVNGPAWTEQRNDGPPKILTQQDPLVYNAFISKFIAMFDGVATAQDVAEMKANLPQFMAMCVREVEISTGGV
jgi:hypothetical protein